MGHLAFWNLLEWIQISLSLIGCCSVVMQQHFQFLQIQTVLQSTGEEGQDELVKLRDDLVELIHVSEGANNNYYINNIIIILLYNYVELMFLYFSNILK